jgi:hypothetical protein
MTAGLAAEPDRPAGAHRGPFDGAALDLPDAVRLASGDRIFDQPVIVDRSQVEAFARDVQVVFDLITALPERLFDGDWMRFARAVDVPEEAARFMMSSRCLGMPRYGRADMYHDGTAFRLLELNVGSEIGGLERAGLLPAAFLAQLPAGHPERGALTSAPTHALVADALRREATATTGRREPVVGLVDAPQSRRAYEAHWQALADLLGAEGLPTVVGDLDTLQVTPDGVQVEGRRVDLVLRYASVAEILDHPGAPQLMATVIDRARRGELALWTPPHSNAFGSKGCLALVSDPGNVGSFTAAERRAVASIVPWTRSLNPALEGRSPADHAALVQHARERRGSLVLKPSTGHGGAGVLIGPETPAAEWDEAVGRAASGEVLAVVQRVVPPRTETFPPGSGTPEVTAAYGAFFTPSGFAGAYARVAPAGHGGVVGISNSGRTKTAAVILRETRPDEETS